MVENLGFFIAGLFLLVVGAEFLVKGASRFALKLGIPATVIGLTIVAYGTSTPEMIVTAQSALNGQSDLSLGNVIGSNIFNILFILGLSAIIVPLVVGRQIIWQEVPIMIAVSLLPFLLGRDGSIGQVDGVFLLTLLIGYTWLQVSSALRESRARKSDSSETKGVHKWNSGVCVVAMLAGLGVLVLGARWLLQSSTSIARTFGIDEYIIGLTIVAAGTSLPEVATSVLASLRKERDIAIGNVVGSNIFNILGVLGVAAILAPSGIAISPAAMRFDIPIMLAVSFSCLPIFMTGHKIARWEGVLFLFFYVAYTVFLILDAKEHALVAPFSGAMMGFVLPLTVITLIVVLVRTFQKGNATVPQIPK